MATPLPLSRRPSEASIALERPCPYCCDVIPKQAKKCRSCGEWVVGTSSGMAAAGLRLLAVIWAGVTLIGALGLWTLGQGVRRWVWMHAVDQGITPQVVDIGLYTLVAVIVLKGLMVSVGLGVMARLSPRRPRWWT
jgi:hypothetical protein